MSELVSLVALQKKEIEELKKENKKIIKHYDQQLSAVIKAHNNLLQDKRALRNVLACLIKENEKGNINDTLWYDKAYTLFDYIADVLGVDLQKFEEKILKEEN